MTDPNLSPIATGHRCTACLEVLRAEDRNAQQVWVSVPAGVADCPGPWSPEHQYAVDGLAHTPEPITLHPYEFRYTTFVEDSEIAYPQEWDGAPITDPARVQPLVAEILDYCAPLGSQFISADRVPLAGTDLTGFTPAHPEAAECWQVVTGGTVHATHSDPASHGGLPTWPSSAEGIVDAGSWANGAEHGWNVGFSGTLDIFAAGQPWSPAAPGDPVRI